MNDFIAVDDRPRLEAAGLASFDALWALQLEAVDEPNTGRGGWSSVYRLELDGQAYYLKRQRDHLSRSLHHPLGEPTFAREFRAIRRYQRLRIPALQAAFYGARRVNGEQRAILLTRALDGWQDLAGMLKQWPQLDAARHAAVIRASAELASRLHGAGQLHGCFYPKHIFLRDGADGLESCLIDLEKTRPLLFGRRDRIRDIEPLMRRASLWNGADRQLFLQTYLQLPATSPVLAEWTLRLERHMHDKATRA
jgi:hypothetical protein